MSPKDSSHGKSARHGESAKTSKNSSKRKQRQSCVVIQSQGSMDVRDEIVWKVSPTAERLQNAAKGKAQKVRAVGEGRSVLQSCSQTLQNKNAPVHDLLAKTTKCAASNPLKKKQSPDMAGKLEIWLSSSQQVQVTRPAGGGKQVKPGSKGEEEEEEEEENGDKENHVPDSGRLNNANPSSTSDATPTTSRARASSSKRPSTSAKRRLISAQKKAAAASLKSAAKKSGQSRKALLDLLDKVDDALEGKGPTLVQSKLSFHRRESICDDTNEPTASPHLQAKREQVSKTDVPKFGAQPPSSPPRLITMEEHDNPVLNTGSSPQECNVREGSGEYNAEVSIKVQALDIRSEGESLVPEMPPSVSVAGNINDGERDPETSSHVSCDPESDAPSSPASIQFLVLEVADVEYEDYPNSDYPQKVLTLFDEKNGVKRFVNLRDSWFHAVVTPGDLVNVIGEFGEDGTCIIDREQNLLVINPDILVSGSKVGSSFACPRRAVLDERIKSNETSQSALMGTMLHQLFQVALRSKYPTSSLLGEEAKSIVQRQVDGLYANGVPERDALRELLAAIPTILDWWKHFIGVQASAAQEVEFGKLHGRQRVSINEVVDIEEMVWSPKYGLKGMMDASVAVKMPTVNPGGEHHLMPLELKTGKATTGLAANEHRAQVILYTMLMSDRYMQNAGVGLLYYLQTNQTQGIEAQHPELTGLFMRRNEHAKSLLEASSNQSLPPMLQSYHMCQGCRQLDACTVYHKAQGGTGESSGLGELFDRCTSHLSDKHVQFFRQWDRLIDLEARDALVSHSQIWKMPSKKREELGRCISSLVLDMSASKHPEYCFRRSASYTGAQVTQSSQGGLQDKRFSCGDYVLLSTESGHTAVAGGTIVSINDSSIMMSLPRRLRIPGRPQAPGNTMAASEVLWRIDKDETASVMGIMRFNLLELFVRSDGNERRRSLIVDLQIPRYGKGALDDSDPAALYLESVKDLNDDQIRAIQKIIAVRDYALILGLPGTGKTSTIVHAVMALLARKASVMLTSYTNSAVDNILLKLKRLGVDFIRVGRTEVIHPELSEKTLGAGVAVTSVKEFQSVVERAQVVGVTCLGINHALFGKRKFDVCIVDEAGQITLPVCLGPLRCADSFVLVGDHYQLPPLVRSPEAREDGMDVSLLRRLSEAHPQSVSVLQSQYRMCSDIMALSNKLIYDSRLRCGSPLVADACLRIREPSSHMHPSWLLQVADPMQRLLFLDTDNLSAEESRVRTAIINPTEAAILLRILQLLHEGGIEMKNIGVISPYNAQVDRIQRAASAAGFDSLEVHTVDKYQGREKDCVLISFVRSNSQREVSGSLLADWRRINVAITRAKTKLVMVGSKKTLSSTPILGSLIQKVAEVGSYLSLPINAMTG